ncbi:MAG: adenylate/guanylate cyclase domain-containing protein [Armatimonadetes bacterium]|nr:adenylate/guanylate cyclase domain-containing protein [Armatimonadota bacterium]
MLSRVRLILLSLVLGVGLPCILGPGLELDLYNTRLFLLRDLLLPDVRQHPAILLVAVDQETRGWTEDDEARVLEQLAAGGAVGALLMRGGYGDSPALEEALVSTGIGVLGRRFLAADGSLLPDDPLPRGLTGSAAVASTDVVFDGDDTVRRAYVALPVAPSEPPVPSGALALFARLQGVAEDQIRYGTGVIEVGARRIPTWPDYTLPVRFLKPERALTSDSFGQQLGLEGAGEGSGSYQYLKPVSLNRLRDPEDPFYRFVRGKVVILGSYQYTAEDNYQTSLGSMAGLQVQACLLDTMFSGWCLRRLDPAQNLAVLLFFVAAVTHNLSRLRPLRAAQLWFFWTGLYAVINCLVFFDGWWVDLARPMIGGLVVFTVVAANQWLETLSGLERFGGRQAADALSALDHGHLLEVRQKTATIVFTNLPDYLKRLEQEDNLQVFARRKEYSQALAGVCERHHGLVMDFQGDAQMLGFGVEFEHGDPEHALTAVRASLEMADAVEKLGWRVDPEERRVFCGVCTGTVAVGQVGSTHKRSQAAIGDTTNVAARLLGAAKKQNIPVIASAPTIEEGGGRIVAEPMGPIPLKGKREPVRVFRVLGVEDAAG